MKRLLGFIGAVLLVAAVCVPAVLAQDGMRHTGRVLISVAGDVTIPAGEQADAIVVVDGTATINGEVNAIVVVDGQAVLVGARAESVVAIGSDVTLGAGTTVSGDVVRLDSQVLQLGDAEIGGAIRDLGAELLGLGFVLGPLVMLAWLGLGLATIAAGLLAAALAARQVRTAGALISREPIQVVVAGLLATFLPLLVVVPLFVTVVGAPLALGILLFLWPLTAFLGYLVAGIWIGEWLLDKLTPETVRERPYLAAAVGIGLLQVLAIVPVVNVIASFVGYGAVVLLAWRTFASGGRAATSMSGSQPLPVAG